MTLLKLAFGSFQSVRLPLPIWILLRRQMSSNASERIHNLRVDFRGHGLPQKIDL